MKPSSWFVRFGPRAGATTRVFCCPFAGGGASWFAEWSRGLDPSLELIALQLPGRENRILEAPCDSMRAIVSGVQEEISRLLDKPYIVYGHSMGASIGFELVRGLLARGFPPPLHFIASASPAPHLPRRRPPISHLTDQEFLQELRRFGGMPEQILANAELLELYLPMLRADFTVVERYRSTTKRAFLPVPTSIHGGRADSMVEPEDLQSWHGVADVVNLTMHDGDHFFIKSYYPLMLDEMAAIARAATPSRVVSL